MNNILVIGNGFDIAHGLNTQYGDFIQFCNAISKTYQLFADNFFENQQSFVKHLKEELDKVFDEKSVSQKAMQYFYRITKDSDKYKFILLCVNNCWLQYIKGNKELMGERWSDFEYIIAEQIEILSYISNQCDLFSETNDMIVSKYGNRLINLYNLVSSQKAPQHDFQFRVEMVKKYFANELNDLTWLLEMYLTRFLNTKTSKMELFEILPVKKLLSFNYTDTYSRIYKNHLVETHYIHGVAVKGGNIEDNNMVFGIGTDIKNTSPDDQYNYVEFQKYYQRVIKKTGNHYTKWLSDNESFFVFFFGHSMDVVDGDVIRNLICCEKAKVIIFYYNQDALKSLVLNLVRIFNQEQLIQYTNEEKILFCKTDDVKEIKRIISYNEPIKLKQKKNKKVVHKELQLVK